MPFRDKVRRVFHRSSVSAAPPLKTNRNGVKIEYYRRNEVPNSKFRGPFDPEHQRRLAAWSFQSAMAERPRSSDLSLSPCTSLPDYLRPRQGQAQQTPGVNDDDEEMAPDQVRGNPVPVETDPMDTSPTSPPDQVEDTQDRQADGGSQSSTMVDPDSYSGSMMTLLPENQEESIIPYKETIRYTSPVLRAASPPPMTKAAYMPFSPEDLTRALNAVQIY